MDNATVLKLTGSYLLLWLLSTVAGVVLVVAGVAAGALGAAGLYEYTPFALRFARSPGGGAALAVLGVLVWKFGTAAALFRTLVTAFGVETDERLDKEALKSDILSVLDARLAEMHDEVSATRRAVDESDGGGGGFDFED